MAIFIARRMSYVLIAVLLAQSAFLPFSIIGQQPADKSPEQWKVTGSRQIVGTDQTGLATIAGPEPTIRVALATDARSATISTTGQLLSATDIAATLVALNVPRVRVEPRLLSPLPATALEDLFRLQIAGAASRSEAEQKAREVREAIDEESQIAYDTNTKTWGLLIGPRHTRVEAEELRARLEDAGFDVNVVPLDASAPVEPGALARNRTIESSGESRSRSVGQSPNQASSKTQPITGSSPGPGGGSGGGVRLVSRSSLPSREVVAFAPGAGRLFSSSAPVIFASDSESALVRFDNRPYRGRIEVFTNTRGALTVVNVLGLEDYVKGVVPNELSAGGYPLIEAHKAQAIAARTYALRNRGQFKSQGYDLLPTTRSQVYRGFASENSLSTRAVDETRGLIATYNGEPINAFYTSTCGGRTEDGQHIFNDSLGYLKGRECAAEGRAALAPFVIKTSRDPAELKDEQNLPIVRDVALLTLHNFTTLRAKLTDSWIADETSVSEVRSWLASVARLTHQSPPTVTDDVDKPGAFATALSMAAFGESRGGTLLNDADVAYFLAIRDAGDVPQSNRADVAFLIREGYLSVLPDATLRPREALSRARALHAISRLLEARGLVQLQKGIARPTADNALVLRSTKGKDQPVKVSEDTFLFRQIGENVHPVKSVALVGGEPVSFHVNAAGEVDYLEVKPAPNGAAADRFSPFTNWTAEMSMGQAQSRLGRYANRIGSLVDLRVVARGTSQRAIDLEIVGTTGTGHVRGGRIRSALRLREQLFVIDKKYDDHGRVVGFTFLGRGWGHGVGMCQVGAYGLARQGFTHEQILKAYYTGIELTRLY
jgi:stage II sporulation protein D